MSDATAAMRSSAESQRERDMEVAAIFSDHMVFQSGIPAPVWGCGEPGEVVSVKFGGRTKRAVVDDRGRWMVRLDPMPPCATPRSMAITGRNSLRVDDILVGEVWLCAGQSNMGYPMSKLNQKIDSLPELRVHTPPRQSSDSSGEASRDSAWAPAVPRHRDVVDDFSIIGFLFGKRLIEELNVPVGVIEISKAASIAESWTPLDDLEAMDEYPRIDRELAKVERADFNEPGYMFDRFVAPLIPFGIAGVLWYQGESNSIRARFYAGLVRTLIDSWRRRWNQGAFHFISVQLPNYDNSTGAPPCCCGSWRRMREAQLSVLELENTALVVTMDIGYSNDLHPANKPEVARRLALAALGTRYKRELAYSGPIYKSIEVEGESIRVKFDHAENGLESGGGALKHFEISGDDMRFFPAEAKIDGSEVVASSSFVKKPVAVRYAWSNDPVGCDLCNREGLPASPFRSCADTEIPSNGGSVDKYKPLK